MSDRSAGHARRVSSQGSPSRPGFGDLHHLMLRIIMAHRPQDFFGSRAYWHAHRFAMQLKTLVAAVGPNAAICDVGGGWGHFAAGCASLGMKAISIDRLPPADDTDPRVLLSREYGFELRIRDVVGQRLDLPPESLEAVTSFDCLEHLHHSPKAMLHECAQALRQGGLMFLGVPNCSNLRKRLSMLVGRCKWTRMSEWYETPAFVGHVREPDVADLRYIAADLGLTDVRVFGRNYQGLCHQRKVVRAATRLVDLPLRVRPSLCADIYLVARKR